VQYYGGYISNVQCHADLNYHFYCAPVGSGVLRSVYVCLSECLSVREHIYGTAGPIFTKFYAKIPCGRGSVLLGRRCDTLYTSVLWMTSRLVVMGRMARRGRLTINQLPLAALRLAALRFRSGVHRRRSAEKK